MIELLKTIADTYIDIYKDNEREYKKYSLIRKILDKENCFLNMDISKAYAILRDLKIPEKEIKKVYEGLISYK